MALSVVSSRQQFSLSAIVLLLQSQTCLIISSHHLVLRQCHVSPPCFVCSRLGIRHVKRSGRYAHRTALHTTTMSLQACTPFVIDVFIVFIFFVIFIFSSFSSTTSKWYISFRQPISFVSVPHLHLAHTPLYGFFVSSPFRGGCWL